MRLLLPLREVNLLTCDFLSPNRLGFSCYLVKKVYCAIWVHYSKSYDCFSLTDQKQVMSEQKHFWPVNVTGACPLVICSHGNYENVRSNKMCTWPSHIKSAGKKWQSNIEMINRNDITFEAEEWLSGYEKHTDMPQWKFKLFVCSLPSQYDHYHYHIWTM